MINTVWLISRTKHDMHVVCWCYNALFCTWLTLYVIFRMRHDMPSYLPAIMHCSWDDQNPLTHFQKEAWYALIHQGHDKLFTNMKILNISRRLIFITRETAKLGLYHDGTTLTRNITPSILSNVHELFNLNFYLGSFQYPIVLWYSPKSFVLWECIFRHLN